MIRSIWRWSHLLLALTASIVLIAASISGVILSFEPIKANKQSSFSSKWNDVTLANAIDSLKSHHYEITSIEKDVNGFYIASVFTEDGEQEIFQFDPSTGKKSAKVTIQSDFFSWMTSFHRSLFLDTTGRFLEGITSVLLFFIAISGIIIVIQRTKSIKALYDKVEKVLNVQYFHIIFGRLAFIPLIIVSVTGGYLFFKRFELIKVEEPNPITIDFENLKPNLGQFDFSKIKMTDIQRVEFPLFEDEQEYYTVFTKDRIVAVNQFKFTILDQEKVPTTTVLSNLSLDLHTGRTNSIWAFILGISAISILYFIYSGFKITILKLKGRTKNKYSLNESEILLLYGSETGNTRLFAKMVYEGLVKEGKKVYLTEMNNYKPANSIQHLIILSATYGTGEAPASASKFIQKWKANPLVQTFDYAVVGFGSLAYPDFCHFAAIVDEELKNYSHGKEVTPLTKIHNQSYNSLKTWALNWQNETGISIQLPTSFESKKLPLKTFELVEKESVTVRGITTYMLKIRAKDKVKFNSGDLLAVYPPTDPHKRSYSIGKVSDNELVISIRLEDMGVCSNYLFQLEPMAQFEAAIESNKSFHYNPSRPAVFIGTGIAPFLGMLVENKGKHETHLYWGGRTNQSYLLYQKYVQPFIDDNSLTALNIALSRETDEVVYVGDLVERDGEQLIQLLKDGAIIYICGSLVMEQSVLEKLEIASRKYANKPLNSFQKKGRVKMDCY